MLAREDAIETQVSCRTCLVYQRLDSGNHGLAGEAFCA